MGAITDSELSRRDVLKLGAGAVAGAAALSVARSLPAAAAPSNLNEMTVAQMQAAMASKQLSSLDLVNYYLTRINTLDKAGPTVNSVIEVNPDAKAIAQGLDAERKAGHVRGPLHGIPVLLKDNVGTGDKMQTAAGSLGLVGSPAAHDSAVAANLRAAGAVILGKTTLSEWANFRSFFSTSGWSGRGGQCNNPYALDRNACGSSSGSGAAVSANLCAVALATETDGSIVCPAHMNGVVGIKPTVGVTSRAGVVPISHTQDTIGPHARTVADAAAVLTVIASQAFDGRDPATGGVPLGLRGKKRPALPADYTQFVNPGGLRGARIGVTRQGVDDVSTVVGTVFDDAIAAMKQAGATIVDLDAPPAFKFPPGDGEFLVLLFEFVGDLRSY